MLASDQVFVPDFAGVPTSSEKYLFPHTSPIITERREQPAIRGIGFKCTRSPPVCHLFVILPSYSLRANSGDQPCRIERF